MFTKTSSSPDELVFSYNKQSLFTTGLDTGFFTLCFLINKHRAKIRLFEKKVIFFAHIKKK